MDYENLFFESDPRQIIPFINVKHVSGNYIYFLRGECSYITFDVEILKEQLEAYKKWVNLSTPMMVMK